MTSFFSELDSIKYIKLSQSFKKVYDFMHENNSLNMDTHFHNILADEDTIYLSNFTLALSKKFDLSMIEQNFVYDYKNYGGYSVNLLHGILVSYKDKEN